MNRKAFIYKLYFDDVEKFYIGSTISTFGRIYAHYHALKKGNHLNAHLQNAFNTSLRSVHFDLVEITDENNRNEREQYYIDKLNPRYNIQKLVINTSFKRSKSINPAKRKLDKDTVLKIIELKRSGHSKRRIAKDLDLTPSIVQHVLKGRCYKDITGLEYFPPKENYRNKVSREDVINIYKSIRSGTRQKDLCIKYGLNSSTLSRINTKSQRYAWLREIPNLDMDEQIKV